MRTPSSSPCQLGLGVVLRHLSLSPYTRTQFSYWHCSSQSLATFTLLSSSVPEWHNSGPLWYSWAVINGQWMFLAITLGGCSRRTQWSSLLDYCSTYTTTTVAVS